MSSNVFPLTPNQFRNFATKAVLGYIKNQFSHFFVKEEIEDIISEVVLRMWRGKEAFNAEKGSLATWVGTIAMNTVRTAAMAKGNRSVISDRFENGEIPDNCRYGTYRGDEFNADREMMYDEFLEGFFSKLKSERDKRFLVWQIEGLDAEEIAEREGITVNNVYMVIFHLRKRLLKAS